MLRDKYRLEWSRKTRPDKTIGYFWAHRFFYKLAVNDTEFRPYYKYMTFLDAGGPHCWPDTLPLQLQNVTPHVYKISAGGCAHLKDKLLNDFQKSHRV